MPIMVTGKMPTAFYISIKGWRIGVSDRLFEWIATLITIGFAITFSVPDEVILHGAFLSHYLAGISGQTVAGFMATLGTLRFAMLCANGNLPINGPRIRSICAALGCVIWVQLALSLSIEAYYLGHASLGVTIYWALSLGEAISIYRARLDYVRR